jgi:hypothetical protein
VRCRRWLQFQFLTLVVGFLTASLLVHLNMRPVRITNVRDFKIVRMIDFEGPGWPFARYHGTVANLLSLETSDHEALEKHLRIQPASAKAWVYNVSLCTFSILAVCALTEYLLRRQGTTKLSTAP